MIYSLTFTSDGGIGVFSRSENRIKNKWLDAIPSVSSHHIGFVVMSESRIIGITTKFLFETPTESSVFKIYNSEQSKEPGHLLTSVNHPEGIKIKLNTSDEPISLKQGQMISCFFKGEGYNPRLTLLIEMDD